LPNTTGLGVVASDRLSGIGAVVKDFSPPLVMPLAPVANSRT